ncbi:putative membrane protein [Pseudonocardia autotrophica]|uniref:DUF1003 domain-containing protein n=2 Tax=Pseudonocardia TaxID=1847 RepID=A0A1Y2N4P4_PSEAH|nr:MULTISPECIES: DUF1003 domain-containing protein [Pseudonocardia]OSY42453.1 hypothetical protein BG845_01373 [Pseudonocardia autotrophica]TDN75973.1 putative membrane protein [Pseudonocardia autotrophica]BBF99945.1 hypothetical protein Pdca_11550 [Pseudonocardia autotrophica]GEC25005.1 hypothetical protein PSA01_20340 [Pseudonocardia saturnea]
MPEITTGRRLDQPRIGRRRFEVDPDGFARLSERVARFLGTGRFLAIQSVIVIVWIALNLIAWQIRWDPYPFILLNLAFSTQAAYAAPLILLAQNRQDDRDRIALDEDRRRAERTKADTEFLARELAALRLAAGETVSRDYLRGELEKLSGKIDDAVQRAAAGTGPAAGRGDRRRGNRKDRPAGTDEDRPAPAGAEQSRRRPGPAGG